MTAQVRPLAFLLVTSALLAAFVPAQAASAPATRADFDRAAAELLKRVYREDAPGGAVLAARGDAVMLRAARGLADVEKRVPLTPDAIFRIGSITKQFSAAGLLLLVEAGKAALEDPLTKHVPGYPGGESITLEQLLNHTSGVRSYTAIPGYMSDAVRKDVTTEGLIDAFKNQPRDFEPGEGWGYSNSGYVLVGAVIEATSGRPWHAHLEEALFKPLRLANTGYGHETPHAGRLVRGYSFAGGALGPMRPMSMTQAHAAGALVSNVDDLFKWTRALHTGRVLSEKSYARMIAPVGKAAEGGVNYGLGLMRSKIRGRDALQHGGGIFGFASSLIYLPGPEITVAVLENDDAHTKIDHIDSVARRLAALALGDPYPEPLPVVVDAADLKAAEGVYRFGAATTRVLRVVDGRLTSQRDEGPRIALTPIGADDFLYDDGFTRLKLERDERGKIARARHIPDGEGEGAVGTRTDAPLPAELKLSTEEMARLEGTYSNGRVTLVVGLEGDVLKARIEGQDAFTLRPKSAVFFTVVETPAELEFSDDVGPAESATIHQNGRRLNLPRVP